MKRARFIWLLLLTILMTGFLCACAGLDNGITPFGSVAFPRNTEDYLFDDSSCIEVNGTIYYDVGAAAEGIEKGECIAAANCKDHYSYRIYKPNDESQNGIVIVNAFSKINLANIHRIYASVDAVNIPAKILDDFPHKDEWWNGGRVTEMNGVNYCLFGSTMPKAIKAGEQRFEFDGRQYYAFPGEALWIMCRNSADPDRFDLYYDADKAAELPISVLVTTLEIVEQ